MNPKLVAKIKAPDTAGKSSIGTGYPVSAEWVVTARHVIDITDRSGDSITVEWSTLKEPVKVIEVKLLDHDIALLRCAVPTALGSLNFSPVGKLPDERIGWKSAGYPDVNGCEWFDATGTFGVDHGTNISLTLDDTCRRDEWGGMSGAPVFSGDKFCAVIITHDQRMEKRLNAVSIPWLLGNDAAFKQIVEPIKQAVIQDITNKLHARLRQEITGIFQNRKNIPMDKLRETLQRPDASIHEISCHLVEQCDARQGITLLSSMSLKLEAEWKDKPKEAWSNYLNDVELVCGWLLLKSVSPAWWFQNEARLKQIAGGNMTSTFALDLPAYIEVIISRSLLQPARYTLGKHNKIKPFGESHDVLLFDASSYGAKDIELLTPIYKDLYRSSSIPEYSDIEELLEDIEDAAMPLRDARGGKVIYYIVSNNYLKLLQATAWFTRAEKRLAGSLQFVCCDQQPEADELAPCVDRQKSLLGQIATILRLRKAKEVAYA